MAQRLDKLNAQELEMILGAISRLTNVYVRECIDRPELMVQLKVLAAEVMEEKTNLDLPARQGHVQGAIPLYPDNRRESVSGF